MTLVRPSASLLALLFVASLLAGCTSDGYLGDVDEGDPQAAAEQRSRDLWRAAGPSHLASTVVSGETLTLGPVAPFALDALDLGAGPFLLGPGGPPTARFALRGAELDGARGWVVFDADRPTMVGATLASAEGAGAFRVADATVIANASGTFARLTPAAAARDLPLPPASLPSQRFDEYAGLALPERVTLQVKNASFHGADGAPRALASGVEVGTRDAVLAQLADGPSAAVHVRLHEVGDLPWNGTLAIAAEAPRGALAFDDQTRALDGFGRAELVARGEGVVKLHRTGHGWGLDAATLDLVDVRTDTIARLGATLRLVPDVVEVNGTAGNVSRVNLVLVETSGGANAQLTGYRIAGDVQARYVGYEPFQVTEEMLRVIRETPEPLTPFAALGIGIAVPFVALVEGVFSILTTFFPPSVAGTLDAGQGRVLTFDLQMPESARDVEILIEAMNAEPARATLRLTPS